MSIESLILSIIQTIERRYTSVVAYGYLVTQPEGSEGWWEIAISDFDIYMHDKQFKKLCDAWRKAAKRRNKKLIFCYCNPLEKKLLALAKAGNLIMDV